MGQFCASWQIQFCIIDVPVFYETPCTKSSDINHESNKISPNCAFSLFFFRFSKSECSNYQQLFTREASNVSISQFKWTLQLAVCATKTAMINSNFSASSTGSVLQKFRQIDKFCQLLLPFPSSKNQFFTNRFH